MAKKNIVKLEGTPEEIMEKTKGDEILGAAAEAALADESPGADDFDDLLKKEIEKEEAKQAPSFTSGFDIGKAVRERIHGFPAFDGYLTKPEEGLPAWILCPGQFISFEIGADEKDYLFPVQLYAGYPEIRAMIDAAIRAGDMRIEHDGVIIFLHAVRGHKNIEKIPGKQLCHVQIEYIFRARKAPDIL